LVSSGFALSANPITNAVIKNKFFIIYRLKVIE